MNITPPRTIAIQAILLLLALLVSGVSVAQIDTVAVDNYAKKVPFFKTFNVEKLTAYLVKPYDTEAEKVRSISTWIGSHIKYDLDALGTGKYKGKTPKTTLRKRRAICEGYAELFRVMCQEAKIEAYVVNGYDKGAFWEREDEFIRDNHAWNSVRIDGDWHLLDLTWFAGYSIEKKRAFRRWLYYKFNIPFTPKYKFHFAANEKYYLTDPHIFIEDHAPDLACWQLLDTIVPIEVFEMDSAAEFFQNPSQYASDYVTGYPYRDSVRYFTHKEEPDVFLLIAKSAYWYNPKNHRILGEYNSLFAHDFVSRTALSTDSPQEKIDNYDSAIVHYKFALDAYKLYSKDCRGEYNHRKAKNKAVTKDALALNNAIVADLKKQRARLNTLKAKGKSSRMRLKAMNSSIASEQDRIDPKKIESTKSANEITDEMQQQLTLNESTRSLHKDSIQLLQDSFNVVQQTFRAGDSKVQNLRFSYKDNGEAMANWIYERALFRKFWSWNVPEHYQTLNGLVDEELIGEKRNFANFDSITVNEMYATAKSIRALYRAEKRQFKAELKLVKSNKKVDTTSTYDEQYEQACENYSATIDRFSEANTKMMGQLAIDHDANKADRRIVGKWIRLLNFESKIERKRHRFYNRYYHKGMVNALKTARKYRSNVHKQITYTQKLKSKSKEELRKQEEELKNQRQTPHANDQNTLTVR